ncbi:MAG: hypothetical protein COA75_03650 [Cellvibrionales bacterium]|nr:MAG: hypothetical protein COA75_03650 [Cellvibrionales bacterium]
MNKDIHPQQKMDEAFDNYFELSKILQSDMGDLLDGENESQGWRRNFIRSSAALIEGYAHCLREVCSVSIECVSPELSKKEIAVLNSESNCDANERFKLTIRAAYKLFELSPAPDFGGSEWRRAQQVLCKRHLLMHPKTPNNLEVPDKIWLEIREDVFWICEQLFSFFSLVQEKYGA